MKDREFLGYKKIWLVNLIIIRLGQSFAIIRQWESACLMSFGEDKFDQIFLGKNFWPKKFFGWKLFCLQNFSVKKSVKNILRKYSV